MLIRKAEVFELDGDRDGAITAYRAAIEIERDAGPMLRLAVHLELRGDRDDAASALALYEEVAHSPNPPLNALFNLAVLFEDRGEIRRAKRCLRKILEADSTHKRAKLFLRNLDEDESHIEEVEPSHKERRHSALLDTPVTDFELSLRARNCLKKMNIRTLGDLLKISEAELLSYRNFGETSLVEIKKMLSDKGFSLGQGVIQTRVATGGSDPYFLSLVEKVGAELLEVRLASLNLSVRARRATATLGLNSVGDLATCTEAELLGVKNFGSTSLDELKAVLTDRGLALRILE